MKKALLVILLLLIACTQTPPAKQGTPATQPPSTVATSEEVNQAPQTKAPAPLPVKEPESAITPSPTETAPTTIDPYTQLGCEKLLTATEFASPCGKNANDLVVTYKVGTKNCFVNIKDRQNSQLTAGITLTGFKDTTTAANEYDRRLKVLKVGADQSVGQRAYVFPLVDRQSINFLRNKFILEVGSDTRLCSKDNLLTVAKTVDDKLH